MNTSNGSLSVQILVSTISAEGVRRLAGNNLPQLPRLSYIVGCQCGADSAEQITGEYKRLFGQRDDMSLKLYDTRGLSASRNALMSEATADVIIFIDDDISLDGDALSSVRDYFADNPEVDMVKTRMRINGICRGGEKPRRVGRCWWRSEYASTISLAIRRTSLAGLVFCTSLGVGAPRYQSGEDDVFFTQALRKGLTVVYLPVVMAVHEGPSTAERFHAPGVLLARGLVLAYVHPCTWPLRAAVLAVRVRGEGWWNNFRILVRGASELKDIAELRRR